MADINVILQNCQNPDAGIRNAAEAQLNQAATTNLAALLVELIKVLADESKPVQNRMLAGLRVKNALAAQSEEFIHAKQQQWQALDPGARKMVKDGAMASLRSPQTQARHTAAQVVGEIGAFEVPNNQWPELLPALLANVTGAANDDGTRQATLEALGFLCEKLDPDTVDQNQVNAVLTAIVDGLKAGRSEIVKQAAIGALLNTLEFAKANFASEAERNQLVTVVCHATQETHQPVRVLAYECIVRVATLFYDHLEAYMQTFFDLTFKTIKEDQEEVALQAVEFWSTICEEELEIRLDAEDAQAEGRPPERASRNYVPAALGYLVKLLTENCLVKQEEDQDDDSWNLSMAGGSCLALVAQAAGDAVIKHVMPFVTQNIKNADWHFREAATMAFGSVLEGPSRECLAQTVNQAMELLLGALKDPHVQVRDTTAWSIGQIFAHHATSLQPKFFQPLVKALLEGLDDVAQVANRVAGAIHNLAAAFEQASEAPTSPMSAHFGPIVQKLLATTERADWQECNLRVTSYETINMLIQNAAQDIRPLVAQMLPPLCERLERSCALPDQTTEQKEAKDNLQTVLLGTLLVIIQKVEEQLKTNNLADRVMQIVLQVLNSRNGAAASDALLVAGSVANAVEGAFTRYMEHFGNFLVKGLQNHDEYQVCATAVGCVGDLSRALDAGMAPYADTVVMCLLKNLEAPALHRSVKPPVLAVFGDLALAIGPQFEKYVTHVMQMLGQAAQTTVPEDDEDMVEYLNTLRESILEGMTGMLQGLYNNGDNSRAAVIKPFIPTIIQLLSAIARDPNRDENVVKNAVGLLGDIVMSLGPEMRPHLATPWANELIQECAQSGDAEMMENATFARSQVFGQ